MVYPVEAQVDADGKWKAAFKTKGAGGPYNLIVKDKSDDTSVELTDILCGEVWLCSGQSNMEWSVSRADNSEEEIANADYPNIRLFHIPKATSPDKQTDVNAKWEKCSPETIPGFSAVGYFFGRSLYKELNIPIGLIESAWGGSVIEAWIPTVGYNQSDRLDALYNEVKAKTPGSSEYTKKLQEALTKVKAWEKDASAALRNGTAVDDMPAIQLNLRQGNHGVQGLYNAMIHPIVPYTIKGAIWYQGESNRP